MKLWQIAKPYLLGGVGVGLLIGGFLLAGECYQFGRDHPKPPPPVAVVLPPTPGEIATPSAVLPCVPVQVLQPSPKRLKEIARETGGLVGATKPPGAVVPPHLGEIVPPAGSSEPDYPLLLVDGRPYPESPAGGKLWVTLEQDGSANVIAKPNEPKPLPAERFFQFGNVFELGGLYGIGQGGDTRSRAWGSWEPVRLGRIHLRAEAGVDLRAGQSDGYVMGGAVWRSR